MMRLRNDGWVCWLVSWTHPGTRNQNAIGRTGTETHSGRPIQLAKHPTRSGVGVGVGVGAFACNQRFLLPTGGVAG